MYSQLETNPHFLPQPPYPQLQEQRPRPPAQPRPARQHQTDPPQPVIPPKTRTHGKHGGGMPPPQRQRGRHVHFVEHGDEAEQHPSPRSQQGEGQQPPSPLTVKTSSKTRPVAWIIAVFCTLFWIIVIVAGLAVLIIYLVYRPRLPKFDISTATLNAAYIDMGYLLNADLTILGNFSNPNKKGSIRIWRYSHGYKSSSASHCPKSRSDDANEQRKSEFWCEGSVQSKVKLGWIVEVLLLAVQPLHYNSNWSSHRGIDTEKMHNKALEGHFDKRENWWAEACILWESLVLKTADLLFVIFHFSHFFGWHARHILCF